MIIVSEGQENDITFYSRYNQINKYEIYDHSTKITTSGLTNIIGENGKINHTGLTYDFSSNNIFSYKAYFLTGTTYYIATHQFIQSYPNDTRISDNFKNINKPKNTFKKIKKI